MGGVSIEVEYWCWRKCAFVISVNIACLPSLESSVIACIPESHMSPVISCGPVLPAFSSWHTLVQTVKCVGLFSLDGGNKGWARGAACVLLRVGGCRVGYSLSTCPARLWQAWALDACPKSFHQAAGLLFSLLFPATLSCLGIPVFCMCWWMQACVFHYCLSAPRRQGLRLDTKLGEDWHVLCASADDILIFYFYF